MSNVPPEPDEFQTRMRQPSETDASDTLQPGAARPAQPQQAPDETQQFAPPQFGAASQPQPPAGYGAPQQTAQQPTQTFGQQPGYGPAGFGQQSQAPQGWPQSQQPSTGGFGQQQPGYAQGGFAQQPGGWGATAAPQRPKDANPLKAAFDFSFASYATPGIVKVVYVVGIVLAVLWYIGMIIAGFQIGAPRDYGFGIETPGTAVPGILAILLGWIPAAFFVLVLRLALEQVLASVRTATDVRVLRERSDAETEKD